MIGTPKTVHAHMLHISQCSLQAAERILAQEDADASRAAAEGAEGGGGEAQGADALMEMGKLNTARIRKAVDPKILDVKKRVRAARRSLKRESKVVLSDEIIFFDDVAGNEQAKVGLTLAPCPCPFVLTQCISYLCHQTVLLKMCCRMQVIDHSLQGMPMSM